MLSMMRYDFITDTYEKILSGDIKTFSPYFFEQRYRKKRVVQLIKYLIEEKLKITPEEAVKKLDYKMLKKYKLDGLLKYVEKPVELEKNDVSHLIYYAYKGSIEYPTQRDLTVRMYKNVLNGKLKTFPKNYFVEGKLGEDRVRYCIEFLCFEILKFEAREVPEKLTVDILKEYKLKIVLNVLYLSMFDMITSVFPSDYSSDDFI